MLLLATQPSKFDQNPSSGTHQMVSRILEVRKSFGRGIGGRRSQGFGECVDLFGDPIAYARIEPAGSMVACHVILLALVSQARK